MRALVFFFSFGIWLLSCQGEATIAIIEAKGGEPSANVGGGTFGSGGGSSSGGIATTAGFAGSIGGGSAGAAGTPAINCGLGATQARGSGPSLLIDSLNDRDFVMNSEFGLRGSYAFFSDASPGANHSLVWEEIENDPAGGAGAQLRIQGKGYGIDGRQGASLDLYVSNSDYECPYFDASAFNAIAFNAKGTVSQELWLEIAMAGAVSQASGGLCPEATSCPNVHYFVIDLAPEFKQFVIYWDELLHEPNGLPVAFDPGQIYSISFSFPQRTGGSVDFDVVIDHLWFWNDIAH
jgi:hypothetical protein